MEKSTKARKKPAEQKVENKVENFGARARYVRYSPYKLRPIADVVRGKGVEYALQWLTTYKTQRAEPIKKLLESAVANAKSVKNIEPEILVVREIRVDQGPIQRYFKPGAQGRAQIQRKRLCHISVMLQTKTVGR
jgi:large subunit ribosomal protein L22